MVLSTLGRTIRTKGNTVITTTTTAAAMVSDARESIDNLTVDQVERELATGAPLLVDIRESEELAATGVIAGAVHAPRGMLEFYADPASPYHRDEFDPSRRVILYCASSGRSALAVKSLQSLGYRDVAHLDGGIKAWSAAGGSLQQS
jgi:rhodanese-related sulfurtransferase